jgi:hypothetical protein
MSLLDRLKELENTRPVNVCPVDKLLRSLDDDTKEILVRLLGGRTSTRSIHIELRNSEYKIARESITNHRNNWCPCKEKP